jgi:hypothetical protein
MTKRKAGPPGPAFRKAVGKQPGPLEFRALLSHCQKDTAPWETVVPKSRASKLAERPPRFGASAHMGLSSIMSRRTNCAAALIPRCCPEPDD